MRKPGPPRDIPPPLELECLKVLWTLGEGNVKDVREVMTRSRNLAYTTVMTILDRLVRKGGVERHKVGRAFVYAPLLSQDVLRRLAVKELVDTFFDGSEDDLILYLKSGDTKQPAFPIDLADEPEDEPQLDAALL
jgi:predicted transcriptional regulator